jgi:hypothetical protein
MRSNFDKCISIRLGVAGHWKGREMATGEGTQTEWHKSSACESTECVEVAAEENRILIRDAADAAGPVLEFSIGHWHGFTRKISLSPKDDRKSPETAALCPSLLFSYRCLPNCYG